MKGGVVYQARTGNTAEAATKPASLLEAGTVWAAWEKVEEFA